MHTSPLGASVNSKSLHEAGITHVVNWSSTAKCNVFDDIEYMCIQGVRGEPGVTSHLTKLDEAVEFVRAAEQAGGKVLSHCWYGRNRSVTLLVAYLMKYGGMTAVQATNLIKQTRPQADPYWDSLHKYSEQYVATRSETNE